VVAWSEVALPAPPIVQVPTLLLGAEQALAGHEERTRRYRDALGGMLTAVTVPNGHNMLWESPEQTIAAIERFVGGAEAESSGSPPPLRGFRL
jgi:pimeloyl-ACP methyl ester carboxylesterase